MTNSQVRKAVRNCDRVVVFFQDQAREATAIEFDENTGWVCIQWDTGSCLWVMPAQVEMTLDNEYMLR